MNIDLLFQIAGVGILIFAVNQVLQNLLFPDELYQN